jgi:glycosyltransferase involved in cell wall biosynthesis
MKETVVLAPASYQADPDMGSDPERPWRLIQGLLARGIRVVVVARTVARVSDLGAGLTLRLLPGTLPTSPSGRLIDRVRLYVYAREVALWEMGRGDVLAVHHFGPCSRWSPSFLPRLPVPFVYGPMPGITPRRGYAEGDWTIWLGVHGSRWHQNVGGLALAKMASPIATAMWRRTIVRADAVTVEARANIPRERPDSVVIPPGLDITRFTPDGAAPVPGRIVAVGSLVRRKGFDVLIRAIALAGNEARSVHLMIAGEGPARSELESLAGSLHIASRVSFLGRLSRRDLPSLYRSAWSLSHPARTDNFPTVVIEAMACGLPAVVSDAGSLPEIVGDSGLVHPAEDSRALAKLLVSVIRDEHLRRTLGAAARDRALSRYSVDALCDRYLGLYRSLKLTRHRRTPQQARNPAEGGS